MNRDRNRARCTEFGSIMYTSVNAIYIISYYVAWKGALGEHARCYSCINIIIINVSWHHTSVSDLIGECHYYFLKRWSIQQHCVLWLCSYVCSTLPQYFHLHQLLILWKESFIVHQGFLELFFIRVSMQPCWNLLGCSSAAQSAGSRKKAHLFSDNKNGIYIWGNGAFDLFIYFFCCCCCCISHASLSVGKERVCVYVCLIRRAVFRNTKQRRRGRLDPGCIRLGTEGAPSGSLEEVREGRRKKKCKYSC